MKVVVIALVLGIAAAMAYFAWQGECRGGQVFASEAQCVAARLPQGLCRDSFAEARRLAREDVAPFATQDECLRQYPFCQPHGRVTGGFVPVPRGVCVVSGMAGKPVFERIGGGGGGKPN